MTQENESLRKIFSLISLCSPQKITKCKPLNFKNLKILHSAASSGREWWGHLIFLLTLIFFSFPFQFNIKQLRLEVGAEGFALLGPVRSSPAWKLTGLGQGTQQGLTAAPAPLPLHSLAALSTEPNRILCFCRWIPTSAPSFMLKAMSGYL